MRSRKYPFLLFLILFSFIANAQSQSTDKLPPVKVTDFRLKNGLRVIFHQDDTTPVVAVNIWYHVGSKNEVPGKTGFAHLFEHMMFQGSKNYSDDYLGTMTELGANVNGTTNEDRTWYFEVVPTNFLERVLYLEADRMGYLLDAMSQEKLDNQRDVVKNERRQSYDNQPYGTADEKIEEIMYPADHPYHWDTIGSMSDLSAASMEDVNSFFRQYYVPNNAVLVLAGKFDEKQAHQWVEKYFGGINKGGDIKRPNPPQPELKAEIRKTYEDTIPLSRLYMVWHTVPAYSPDEAALDVLESILSSGRSSRLQGNLVFGKEIAQNVFASNDSREIAGLFNIVATAKKGKTLEENEKEINAEIERIKKEQPTADEMTRALNAIESQMIFRLETVLGKGSQLSSFAGFLDQPDYFQANLDRYRKVTAADVQRVANKYLTNERLVMSFVPRKGEVPKIDPTVNKTTTTSGKKSDPAMIASQKAKLPKGGSVPSFSLPTIEKSTLSNGLNVWVVQRKKLPIVSMNMVLDVNGSMDPADKGGVANFTAGMLNQGTKTRSANEISNQLQAIGASLSAGSGWDATNVTMQTLTKNLDQALDIFSDVIVHPVFPSSEFEVNKRRALGALLQRKSNPTVVADIVYNKVLYANQAYGHQLTGDEKSLGALLRDDLTAFYDSYYRPNEAALIVVGDVDTKTLVPKLEKVFSDWQKGDKKMPDMGKAEMMAKPGIFLVDKPGAAQSSVSIGQVGIERSNPDYYALQVMNSVLGGSGGARLFMNLREDKGYTYGAYSRFAYRRGAGPFSASAEIQTVSTKEAIVEFLKELNGIRGAIPISPEELETNKQSLIRRFPGGFETDQQVASQLANLVIYGLPSTYYNDYIQRINAVTGVDVNRVANKYLDPSKMAIVVVGDRKVVEPKLKELGFSMTILDPDGNLVDN